MLVDVLSSGVGLFMNPVEGRGGTIYCFVDWCDSFIHTSVSDAKFWASPNVCAFISQLVNLFLV